MREGVEISAGMFSFLGGFRVGTMQNATRLPVIAPFHFLFFSTVTLIESFAKSYKLFQIVVIVFKC